MPETIEKLAQGLDKLKLGFDKKAYHARKATCPRCGCEVCAHMMTRHQDTQKCKLITFWKTKTWAV